MKKLIILCLLFLSFVCTAKETPALLQKGDSFTLTHKKTKYFYILPKDIDPSIFVVGPYNKKLSKEEKVDFFYSNQMSTDPWVEEEKTKCFMMDNKVGNWFLRNTAIETDFCISFVHHKGFGYPAGPNRLLGAIKVSCSISKEQSISIEIADVTNLSSIQNPRLEFTSLLMKITQNGKEKEDKIVATITIDGFGNVMLDGNIAFADTAYTTF